MSVTEWPSKTSQEREPEAGVMMVISGSLPSLLVWESLVYMAANQMTSSHLTKHVYDTNATLIINTRKQTCG